MAMIVLDDSIVGVSPTPGGGFAIQLKECKGVPEGLDILIPFEGENAEQVYERIAEVMGKNPASSLVTATPGEVREEAAKHGLDATI